MCQRESKEGGESGAYSPSKSYNSDAGAARHYSLSGAGHSHAHSHSSSSSFRGYNSEASRSY